MDSIFNKYLNKLEVQKKKPGLGALDEIVAAHILKIPFENISKIHYFKNYGLNYIPDFELYVNGLIKNNFGGTCYSNNHYLNKLLNYLGYDVKLCGADMTKPDVHIVNIVNIEDREYLVDCGYAAPFMNPMPLDLSQNYEVLFGANKYVLLPKDSKGLSAIQLYRNGKLNHGYKINPRSRTIEEFDKIIKDSFRETATFLNAILLTKFGKHISTVIHNFSVLEYEDTRCNTRILNNENELINEIENKFQIPVAIVKDSLSHIKNFNDAWT
jgi:arylamine N-acetyltransferase